MLKLNFLKRIKAKLFPFYKNKDIQLVFKILQGKSPKEIKTAMFVGGCVRKFLANEEIDDIDIATSLSPEKIKEKFLNTKFNVIESGIEHGTITIISKKLKIEITTLRKDIKTDGRHAEVEFTEDWKSDSERRDFTINSIYLDNKGKIFDPQMGVTDLKNKNLKFIGDPNKRIEEDYLRIIRFVRFALEYNCKLDTNTLKAIQLNLDGIKKISKDRILNELFKILKSKYLISLENNTDLKNIFLLIFPEFKYLYRLSKLNLLNKKNNFKIEDLLAILLIDEFSNHEYFLHKYNVSNQLKNNLNLL